MVPVTAYIFVARLNLAVAVDDEHVPIIALKDSNKCEHGGQVPSIMGALVDGTIGPRS